MAHYCLHRLRLLPSQFLALEVRERAFIVASIRVRLEAEKEQEKKMKRAGRRGK